MPDSPATVVATSPDTQAQISGSEKRRRWLELYLVLFVAFGSSVTSSLYMLANGAAALPHPSNSRWILGILHQSTALLLLVYVLSRRGLGLKDLGFRWSVRDAGMGILLAFTSRGAYLLGYRFIQTAHYRLYGSYATVHTPKEIFGHLSILFAIYSWFLTPLFEELIVRAYVITEIIQLTGSSALAVILCIALQFSYHLYYGWTTAAALACGFTVFALYYARTRRALPLVVAHALLNIQAGIRLL